MLRTGTSFSEEIPYGQSLCINFIFHFYEGPGGYFVLVLLCPRQSVPVSVLRAALRLPRQGLPLLGAPGGFSWTVG